jgi:hypothetical protein
VNFLDSQLQSAAADDRDAFASALQPWRCERRHGARMPVDPLVASELVLPASDTGLEQVRSLLVGEGLIPG